MTKLKKLTIEQFKDKSKIDDLMKLIFWYSLYSMSGKTYDEFMKG